MANITLTLEEYQDILDRLETVEDEIFKDSGKLNESIEEESDDNVTTGEDSTEFNL